MRHLIDPLDFTQEETNPHTRSGRTVSHCIPMHTVMLPMEQEARNTLSMSQVPEPVCHLSQPCSALEDRLIGFSGAEHVKLHARAKQ